MDKVHITGHSSNVLGAVKGVEDAVEESPQSNLGNKAYCVVGIAHALHIHTAREWYPVSKWLDATSSDVQLRRMVTTVGYGRLEVLNLLTRGIHEEGCSINE